MKILVTNTVMLNGGDAAILMALERQIRNVFGTDTEIVVADTQPELARTYYPQMQICSPLYLHAFPPKKEGPFPKLRGALRFARWYASVPRLYLAVSLLGRGMQEAARLLVTAAEWSTLEEYASADAIVSTGGTYLVDNYWLGPRIFDFRIALLLGKPLVLYTQSIGTFSRRRTRAALSEVFRGASAVILRDEQSLRNVNDLCDPEEVTTCVAADAAFSLADPDTLAQAALRTRDESRRLSVVVSVRRWPFFRTVPEEEGMEAYKQAVTALVEHLVLKHDAKVEFLSTCQGVEDYVYDDSKTAAEIADRLSGDVREAVTVDHSFHDPFEIVDHIKGCDVVVATRMHMAILALVAGVPVLPIAYEFKTAALFGRLDMTQFVHDIEDVSAEALIRSAQAMIGNLSGIRAKLFPRVEAERDRAIRAEACLEEVLPSRIDGMATDTQSGCATTAD